MGNTVLIRTALRFALIAAFGLAASGRAPAADPRLPPPDGGAPLVKVPVGDPGVIRDIDTPGDLAPPLAV